ncbi:MAG TPA: cell surface protein SprA, partial [Gemmatimonadaceae bacterium]|nr:cell surface protein SprA [Gemmatimonadaceae bacterium]
VTTGGTPDLEFRPDREQFANLLWDPQVTPGDPAFDREIRSIYRIGGPEVRRQSVVVKVVMGTGEDQEKVANDPGTGEATLLQLFGLAQKTNSSTFDIENRLWPRPSDANFELSLGASASKVIRDQFLVFPSLRPFARNGLVGARNPANDTIYTTPSEYVKSAQRPIAVYHIRTRYQAEGNGEAGSLMLGAVQVRPNSERLFVDGIPLVRGTDYTVDYDLGRVSFARPDTLFPRPRQVSVQFEENPVFAETPTSIFGATAEIPLAAGIINFTAISQTQTTTFNRPPLGFEPAGSLVAGVTALFNFDASPLTSLVSHLPYGATTAPSRISVSGEFAASRPEPNVAGQAYLESFEGEGGIQVSLLDNQWYLSSQPALGRQFPLRFGAQTLDLSRASTLAWQSDGLDANGRAVRYTIEQIDSLTNLVGTGISGPEPVLWMTLYPLSKGGLRGDGSGSFKWTVGNTPTGKRWRSIRTPLGPSGSDLSRVENIEFWAQIYTSPSRRNRNPTLMLDFGDVSENSVTFGPDTAFIKLAPGAVGQDTTYTGKKIQGFDRLDSERDPFSRAFNVGVNDTGLAGDLSDPILVVDETLPGGPNQIRSVANFPTCRGGFSFVHLLGDSRVDCTVGNNRLDEEDIDGDNILNLTSSEREQEQLRRYIVNMADPSKYNRVGICSVAPRAVVGPAADSVCWVLFKIPFRAPDDSLGAPLLRRIKAMRITMLSSDAIGDAEFSRIGIARLRLTGAPWIKRLETGIRGIAGEQPGSGFVNASTIGTQDRKLPNAVLDYESPPGVVDEPDTKRSNFETTRIQVNERSLRLTAGDIALYDRAEAYYRFPEGEKNFMAYKELRLWARGVRNGWGTNGDLQFFVKIGRDPNNFYLYHTPLSGGLSREAWLPEIKVDFQKLFKLRAEIQNAYLDGRSRNSCTGIDSALIANTPVPSTGRYIACADGYIAYTSDPGVSPPNLAAVQEMAVGMIRTGVGISSRPIAPGDTLELWVDDIRLGGVVDAAGFAGQIGLSILASDFADIRINVSRRDPNFRQLAEQPTFLTDNNINVSSAFHLEKLLPKSFGLTMPFTLNYTSATSDPLFVSQSDVEGDIVEGLRTPRSSATSITFSVARATPSKDARLAALWNNLTLTSTYTAGDARSEYESGRAHNFTVGLDYNLTNALLPGLARFTPAELHLTSVYSRGSDRRSAYLKPAFALDDVPRQINGLT